MIKRSVIASEAKQSPKPDAEIASAHKPRLAMTTVREVLQ